MRLADFILRNMEAILKEWESFAATLLPSKEDVTFQAIVPEPKSLARDSAEVIPAYAKALR